MRCLGVVILNVASILERLYLEYCLGNRLVQKSMLSRDLGAVCVLPICNENLISGICLSNEYFFLTTFLAFFTSVNLKPLIFLYCK